MGKIKVHILSVLKEKGEGYTVVAEVRPDTDITSEEIWQATLPGARHKRRPGILPLVSRQGGHPVSLI
jgi:hypothetical protein